VRLALGISYNGRAYEGWQSQASGRTVQDQLETALGKFAGHRVTTLCAGRTDAGVHAVMQVVHFDTLIERPLHSWVRGTNTFLPRNIAVQWAHQVPAEFHCRASAQSRRYRYILLESPVRPSLDEGQVGWVFKPLQMSPMLEAAQVLIGEHDFSSFRAAACQALSPVKDLRHIDITRQGAYWRFEFEANAFLHHMIRNIMGCLISIGQGKHPPGWMGDILAARSRTIAAPTFSPDGLYFLGPTYEAHWGLPDSSPTYDGWL
jgi:tRNA pseudouridine38-40 synthase